MLDHSGLARYSGGVAVLVGDGAQVTLVSVQDWAPGAVHGGQYDAVVGRDATFKQVVVTLGGDLVRLVSNVQYAGPGGSAELFGVYFADETQHQEHRLWVDHAVPELPQQRALQGRAAGRGRPHGLDRRRPHPPGGHRHRDLRAQPQPGAHRRRPRRLGAQPGDRDRRDRRRRPRQRHRPVRRRAAVLPLLARHRRRDRPPPRRPRLLRRRRPAHRAAASCRTA